MVSGHNACCFCVGEVRSLWEFYKAGGVSGDLLMEGRTGWSSWGGGRRPAGIELSLRASGWDSAASAAGRGTPLAPGTPPTGGFGNWDRQNRAGYGLPGWLAPVDALVLHRLSAAR